LKYIKKNLRYIFLCSSPHSLAKTIRKIYSTSEFTQVDCYAEGFLIEKKHPPYFIRSPWPKKARKNQTRFNRGGSCKKQHFKRWIRYIHYYTNSKLPTSTTWLQPLEPFRSGRNLVGFPWTDYVSRKTRRVRIDNGNIEN
jgi:hypothetical protein